MKIKNNFKSNKKKKEKIINKKINLPKFFLEFLFKINLKTMQNNLKTKKNLCIFQEKVQQMHINSLKQKAVVIKVPTSN